MGELDADALARLEAHYATPKPAPRCAKCRGTMVWDNVWTPRHAPRMTIYVCHYCRDSEHVMDGDPDVLELVTAYRALTADLARERDRADKAEGERGQMIDLYTAQSEETTQLVADARTALELRIEAQHQRDEAEAERDRLAAEVAIYREELRDLLWQCPPCDGTGILDKTRGMRCYVCDDSRDVLAPLKVEMKAPWPPSAAREGEGTDG